MIMQPVAVSSDSTDVGLTSGGLAEPTFWDSEPFGPPGSGAHRNGDSFSAWGSTIPVSEVL
jgi:hypothetical protein